MSVTPRRSSPTWSARRMAWTRVATSAPPVGAVGRAVAHAVDVGEDVPPDVLARRLRLLAHALARLEQLLGVPGAQLVHRRARHQLALLEALLGQRDAVGLLGDEVGPRGRRVAVEARDHRLEEERLSLGAHVLHRARELAVGDLGIVAVDDGGLDAERLAAVGHVPLAVLLARGR